MALTLMLIVGTSLAGQPGLTSDGYTLRLAGDQRQIVVEGPGGVEIGRAPLCELGLADGSQVDMSEGEVGASQDGPTMSLELIRGDLSAVVLITAGDGHFDIDLAIATTGPTVLWAQCPGPLRFDEAAVERMITPTNGNFGVGLELLPGFFSDQAAVDAKAWTGELAGGDGYRRLLGGDPVMRPDQDVPVPLTVTPEGAQILAPGAAEALDGASAIVNRPPSEDVPATALIASEHGAWLSLASMGDGGVLWIGGAVQEDQRPLARRAIAGALTGLGGQGRRAAVIRIPGAPERAGWATVSSEEWIADLSAAGMEVQVIDSLAALAAAVTGGDGPWAILNPYGELIPTPTELSLDEWVDTLAAYANRGGVWVETGGFPFFYRMVPRRTLRFETDYPAGFADFHHLETSAGSLSWYRIAPREHGPWDAAVDPSLAFVPGHLACGRDENGPFMARRYTTHVAEGQEWSAPTTRIQVGQDAFDALDAYATVNALRRPLAKKMPPDLLDAFRRSVLVYFGGSAAQMIDAVEQLPSPSVLHTASYLKGGFDKEYPDHLPPAEDWGTPAELSELLAACEEHGILFMPYTNPTWWCDDPRGPSFIAAGEVSLARDLEGEPYPEAYGTNRGWTITFWHDAVREANERTRRQFTEEFPVDLLFQDQCGARGSKYDTNPASPSPMAYIEGLISMVEEDSGVVPLSTEAGWDRLLAFESQFCGMSWRQVPTEGGPDWRRPYTDSYPPSTFRPFPLAQALGHDSVSMIHHDLGQFVTNDEVLSWTLGLGFGLSYRLGAGALDRPEVAAWLGWLAELQEAVAGPATGEPLTAWEILGGDGGAPVFRATYGDITITANTTAEPFETEEHILAPHGFLAQGPGLLAGALQRDGDVTWFCRRQAPEGQVLTVLAPERTAVAAPDLDGLWVEVVTGPSPGTRRIAIPAELSELPPSEWPRAKRPSRIGVVQLPPDISPSWTSIGPAEWLRALEGSVLAARHGLTIEALTPQQLREALAPPSEWLAIINPYGEVFPVVPGTSSMQTLERIREYVEHGGVWWETGGYSFYGGAGAERIQGAGLGTLGIELRPGEIDAPPAALASTEAGQEWLSAETLEALAGRPAPANRGASPGGQPRLDLVASPGGAYVSGYRLEGWGWLWRLGGMHPPGEVAVPIVVDVLSHLWTQPWPEPERDARRYLWRF